MKPSPGFGPRWPKGFVVGVVLVRLTRLVGMRPCLGHFQGILRFPIEDSRRI